VILVEKLRERPELKRFVKFGIVGFTGALVDFASFNVLGIVFHLGPALAGGISFVLAVTSNFVLNRFWTFPDSRSRTLLEQAGQYLLVNLVGLGIRELILHFAAGPTVAWFQELALPVPLAPEILGENFLLGATIGIVLFWNFFVNRYWTYNDVE
jgi:putative flippase GtrA